MQCLHLTYTWDNPKYKATNRHQAAIKTWRRYSEPGRYRELHFTPKDVDFHGHHFHDVDPYPILTLLIDKAFRLRDHDTDCVVFTNSDIKLRKDGWCLLHDRMQLQLAHFEDAIQTRSSRRGETTSDPVTFVFPWSWWRDHRHLIPPVFFACPYWEHPIQEVIKMYSIPVDVYKQFTSHTHHPYYKNFGHRRTPCRKWNHAIAKGWHYLKYDLHESLAHMLVERKDSTPCL